MKFCSKCGKQIEDAAPFCQFCGQPQNSQPQAPYTQPAASPYSYAQPTAPQAPVKKKKKKIWIPIVIIVALLSIAAGVITPLFLLTGSFSPEDAARNYAKALYNNLDAEEMYKYSVSRSMQKALKKVDDHTKSDALDKYNEIIDELKEHGIEKYSISISIEDKEKLSKSELEDMYLDDEIIDVVKKSYRIKVKITIKDKETRELIAEENLEAISYKSMFKWYAMPI